PVGGRLAAAVAPDPQPRPPSGAPHAPQLVGLLRDQRLDERPPGLDPLMTETAPAIEGRRFGSGWISGAIAAVLGPMSFGAVLCLRFPQYLTSPHLRELYPMSFMRGLIHVCLVASFVL